MSDFGRSAWTLSACVVAAFALGGVAQSADPEPTIAALEMQLVDDSPAVRAKGAAALASRFPDGAAAVPMLLGLLDDEDPAVVAAAGTSLDALGVAGLAHIATYVPRLEDAATKDGFETLRVLLSLSEAKPVDVLWTYGEMPVDLGHCVAAAVYPSDLARHGVRALEAAVAEPPSPKRTAAAAALASVGMELAAERRAPRPFAESAQRSELLKTALGWVQVKDDLTVFAGLRFAAKLRPRDKAAADALVAATRLPEPERYARTVNPSPWATLALAAMGPDAAPAAPRLLELVDERASCRRTSVRALIGLGRKSELKAWILAKPVSEKTAGSVGDMAGALLVEGGPDPEVAAKLVAAVVEGAKPMRGRIRTPILGGDCLGPAGAPLVPQLRQTVERASDGGSFDENAIECARCLLSIVPDDLGAVDYLLRAAQAGEPAAIVALGAVCDAVPGAAAAQEGTVRAPAPRAGDPEAAKQWRTRAAAVENVARLKAQASADSVPAIVKLLAAWNASGVHDAPALMQCDFAAAAARTLGKIGPAAKAAIPALEAMRASGDERCRVAAAQALRRIKAAK